MCIENGIDVPTLGTCYGHQRLIACLSPSSHIFASLFENAPQCVRRLLVQTMQCIAMHVVSHFRLIYVTCTRLLCISKHLVRHLPDCIHTTQDLQFNKQFKASKRNTNADYYYHHPRHHSPCQLINHYPIAIFDCPLSVSYSTKSSQKITAQSTFRHTHLSPSLHITCHAFYFLFRPYGPPPSLPFIPPLYCPFTL